MELLPVSRQAPLRWSLLFIRGKSKRTRELDPCPHGRKARFAMQKIVLLCPVLPWRQHFSSPQMLRREPDRLRDRLIAKI